MRGPTKLRGYISEFLEHDLPPVLDVARQQWGLDEYTLPDPKKYDVADPTMVGNDEYPAIGCVIRNDANHVRSSWDVHAEQIYSPNYTVAIFVVVRTPQDAEGNWITPEKTEVIRLRDDLTRMVQHILLQTPGMLRPEEVRMEETSMKTDFLEPYLANTQSKRLIAASVITVDFVFTESTVNTAIGTANTITVTENKLF